MENIRKIKDIKISSTERDIYSDLFSQNTTRNSELSTSDVFEAIFESKQEIPLKSFDIWFGDGLDVELRISDGTTSEGKYLVDVFIFGREEMRIPLEPLEDFTGVYRFEIEGEPYGIRVCTTEDEYSNE